LLKRGVDVILDDGFFLAENRRQYFERARAVESDATVHVVWAPRDIIQRRLVLRNANLPPFNFRIDPEMLDVFLAVFTDLNARRRAAGIVSDHALNEWGVPSPT